MVREAGKEKYDLDLDGIDLELSLKYSPSFMCTCILISDIKVHHSAG